MTSPKLLTRLSSLLAALLLLAWLPGLAALARAAGGTDLGQFEFFKDRPLANDFRMGSLDGRVFKLSDLKGNVVLLNFWRKNCRFCSEEKRYLMAMVEEMNSPGLKVLCVDFWDSPAWLKVQTAGQGLVYATKPDEGRFILENTVRGRLMGYFVLNDAGEAVYEVKGFPSTYVIDKDGRVVASHLGLVNWRAPAVRKWIAGLVGSAQTGRPSGREDYLPPGWLDTILSGPAAYGPAVREAQAAPSR